MNWKAWMAISVTCLVISVGNMAQAQTGSAADDLAAYRARYGRAEMETSCSPAAKVPFEKGLLLLHSFAWAESRKGFQ